MIKDKFFTMTLSGNYISVYGDSLTNDIHDCIKFISLEQAKDFLNIFTKKDDIKILEVEMTYNILKEIK